MTTWSRGCQLGKRIQHHKETIYIQHVWGFGDVRLTTVHVGEGDEIRQLMEYGGDQTK